MNMKKWTGLDFSLFDTLEGIVCGFFLYWVWQWDTPFYQKVLISVPFLIVLGMIIFRTYKAEVDKEKAKHGGN